MRAIACLWVWALMTCTLSCRYGLDVSDTEDLKIPATCFVPSNLRLDGWSSVGDASLFVVGVWVADTDTGEIIAYSDSDLSDTGEVIRPAGVGVENSIGFSIVPLAGTGSGVGVFSATRLEIPEADAFIGIGPRPLALLIYSEVLIDGRLSVAAQRLGGRRIPGAGGGRGGSGGTVGNSSGNTGQGAGAGPGSSRGGAGGSYGSLGGRSGSEGALPTITLGTSELVPLLSGFGGGGGGGSPSRNGGHGGGGIQLSTCGRIVVSATGVIDASGGAGLNSAPLDNGSGGGGGGGSGGSILIESNIVRIAGFVASNGGGGGGALTGDGQDGSAIQLPALGGAKDRPGTGGNGSDMQGETTDGTDEGCCAAGGGGGGAGRIRINTPTGNEIYEAGISPATDSGLLSVGQLLEP